MLDNLFNNAGPKIRNFAKVMFLLESAAAILGGLAMVMEDSDEFLIAFFVILAGVLAAYWTSVFIAGIGENIESTTAIKETNEQILHELTRLNQKTVAPAVPTAKLQASTPAQTAAKAPKSLHDHLVYACNYTTDEAMRAYLNRFSTDDLTAAEKSDLATLLAQESLRTAVRDYLNQP